MRDIFSQILNMSLTGTVVILFVLAARLLLKKAPKIFSYALWAVVLFRLLCPVSLPSPVSLLELTKPQVTESAGITSSVSYIPAQIVSVEPRQETVPTPQPDMPRQEKVKTPVSALTIASYIWLAGMTVMAVYSILTYARLRCKLIGAVRYRNNIYLADHIASPFVLGILRPKIYLPSNTPLQEQRFIVAHERHHIRRGDHIVKLLAYGALCLHWFNPFAWVAFVQAGKDMEMSCDEAVIKKLGAHIRADYSASLLRLATHQRIIAGTPLAFGEGDTKGRVMNMAKWKKPKVWVSILCMLLCIAVLVACAVNPEAENTEQESSQTVSLPEEGEKTDKDIAFEKVKAVFDAVQSGSYQILAQQKNEGKEGPSGYVTTYFSDGENWLRLHETVTEGTNQTEDGDYYNRMAHLSHKGFHYSNDGHWGERGAIQWSAITAEQMEAEREGRESKLAVFHWHRSNVTYLDTVTDENGECIRYRINKLYADQEDYADYYFANFYFDPDGNFRNVQFLVNQDQDNAFTVTESIVTLDRETVAEQIESYYGYGIPVKETTGKPVISGSTITTNAELVQYGALTMTLPEGYTCREENGSIILAKDGADVGGITCWASPGYSFAEIPDVEWLRAMGLPEAQESDEPIAYMMGNSLYGDLEAEFFNERDLEALNVEHEFFIVGDLVYDVYYNQNLISDGKAEKFLKTIQISGQPVVTPDPSEEESLTKCRNILSLIQSGSYAIASDWENQGTVALNDYSYRKFWQHNGNWLSIAEIPESGGSSFFYYMEVGGVHYNTERTGWDETGPIWAEQRKVEVAKPWLATFRWDPDIVTYENTLINGGEECVMLRIDEPYPNGEDNSEFYFVNFYFAEGSAFLRAEIQVNLFLNNAFMETESIITLDAETVAAEIEKEYNRAIAS